MPDNFDTAYEPVNSPFFVYDADNDLLVATGTYKECEEFIVAISEAGVPNNYDIRRNN